MSALRTLTVALAATLAAAPGGTVPLTASERALAFAACAGRYSAEMEHRWLVAPSDSAEPEARRDAFVALLEAVTEDALARGMPAHLPLATRIEEKAAQAALLARATFHPEPDMAEVARVAAARRIAACGVWLLDA